MKPRDLFLGIVAMLLVSYFLAPLYIMLMIGFSPAKYTIESLYPSLYFKGFTLNNLVYAFTQYNFLGPFIKSMEVATLVGLIAILLGVPAGYGLSRLPQRLSFPLIVLLLITNMVPGLVVSIPISAEFVRLHLFDTVPGLALVQELVSLPLAVFIMQGAFSSIPREVEYQARLDGASALTYFTRVLIPSASTGVAAAFLISWMFSWDEFTYAVILSPIHPTLPVVIYNNITRGNVLAAVAFSLVFTLPVIVLTVALQKYLRGEYLAGGVKA